MGVKKMQDPISRKLFLAFMHVHILHHAAKEPIYGTWMIKELNHHGYEISAGTLYPIFHAMEKNNLLTSEKIVVDGKTRKYYSITEAGKETLASAKDKIGELSKEVLE